MIQQRGWWLPDRELHFAEMLKRSDDVNGRGTYQYDKLVAAISYCAQFRLAVDIGANVGFWSWHLAKRFQRVDAFEPVLEHQRCFLQNVPDLNVHLHVTALGDKMGFVALREDHADTPSCSRVDLDVGGDIPVTRLDDWKLWGQMDFLKVDCEGYEYFILQGARQSILRDRPVICVEQKRGHAIKYGIDDHAAIPLLESWGYRLRQEMRGDYIFTWREN